VSAGVAVSALNGEAGEQQRVSPRHRLARAHPLVPPPPPRPPRVISRHWVVSNPPLPRSSFSQAPRATPSSARTRSSTSRTAPTPVSKNRANNASAALTNSSRRELQRRHREGRRAHPRQARPGGALGLPSGAGPGRGCGAEAPF
jgi:hypothetical protein